MTNDKPAITHIGTTALIKEDRPYVLPTGITMWLQFDVSFIFVLCKEHVGTHYHLRDVLMTDYIDGLSRDPDAGGVRGIDQVLCGFLSPEVGWKIMNLPGFQPKPALNYHSMIQIIPQSLRAYVL